MVHTGQHYDEKMSDIFFSEFGIEVPVLNLEVGSMSHGHQTGAMLAKLEEVFEEKKPDIVLIYGDTNSTLAAALAAAKMKIPLAHVEAGLRSFNRAMPEEINRIVADSLSDLLFAPTQTAVDNLAYEGVKGSHVLMTGDIMQDVALEYGPRSLASPIFENEGIEGDYALCTIHRAENTDSEALLGAIVHAIAKVSETLSVVLPMHPRTTARLESLGLASVLSSKVKVLAPVGYLDMMALTKRCSMIITDSGGLQKEAYFNRRPCVTLREETEWVETVESGWNFLAPPSLGDQLAEEILSRMGVAGEEKSLYGDGQSSKLIIEALHSWFASGRKFGSSARNRA